MLFYETYFEEGNINWKPLIWSHYNIITNFGQKTWVSSVLGKVYENIPKIKKKCYFTYFEESNRNQKQLIWSKNKVMTKFAQKQWASFIFCKVYGNYPKINEKCYFRKPTSKRVILIGNHLFGPNIR